MKANAVFKRKPIRKFFEVIPVHGDRMIFKEFSVSSIKKILEKYNIEYLEIKKLDSIIEHTKSSNFYTVGELKEYIVNLPDSMPILYELIEDSYFKENGWNIIPIYQSENYPCYSEFIPVFTPFVDADEKYLCITAHY